MAEEEKFDLSKLVAEDKKRRVQEFAMIMQRETRRLQIEVTAEIEAEGSMARARVKIRAL